MALSSPGVEVKVIDESFYTPAAPGTVPLIIVATAENKANSGATGTAPGTLKANAGEVYLLTSQRDLGDTFGDPVFKTDASNNPVHAGEQNEYGLQAAYSLLGVSNRAFVVRADLDLDQLDASATEPNATPANGTHWLDTSVSTYGIFEWNNALATARGGQTFANKVPTVITDSTKLSAGAPKPAVGAIGDYAIVVTDDDSGTPALTSSHPNQLYYKNRSGTWVKVGSTAWQSSWAAVTGTAINPSLNDAHTFLLNDTTINPGTTIESVATAINDANITGVTAAVVNSKLEIYVTALAESDGNNADGRIYIEPDTGTLIASTAAASSLGIATGYYSAPKLTISKHTQVPQYKSSSENRPTGSIWVKTTEPNLGARFRVKRWNESTLAWEQVTAPVYSTGQDALYGLDPAGGGTNLAVGQLYVQTNLSETLNNLDEAGNVDWKVWRKSSAAPTVIRTAAISTQFTAITTYSFEIAESLLGTPVLGDYNLTKLPANYSAKTVSFETTHSNADADRLAAAINAAGFTNIEASVDSQYRVSISHKLGGEFRIVDDSSISLVVSAFNYSTGAGTAYLSVAPDGDTLHDFVASNWEPLTYVANADAPSRIPADGRLWYSSVIDEVDIMIHDGDTWVGYVNGVNGSDAAGPQVGATAPETQSDGVSSLVTGDLWVSTADMENFPQVYKYNAALAQGKRWVLVDKTDQSTEDGILFADARYNTAGANSDEAGTITALLESDYLDPDAPDPALYPQGMLLWNLRRSGYNVKQFVRDQIDIAEDNIRQSDEPMADYYPHRWVTVSANQADGSGSFGRKAQRAVVVKALQATVNSNQQIRDEDGRIFNLIACPGYPELIGEMVTLNYDRGLTAFVVGDTPARLTSDATSLLAWGNNANGALEDNDIGAASFDEYMAMFYPWGFSSDNFGNNIAVPPSHMILRTIALNDQVAYPWFAPAGVRRGGITNATAVGYISSEGEFKSVALNNGQRDTLYETKINPITFFTGTGLVNYGQKTRARAASALDRINVARLVIHLRRQLSVLAKPYIFEPNDKITRDEIKGAVEALLLELVGQRALYDYLVVCDESNNTPSRIDRNELWIDIAIEPVKAVEFIYIPLRLKNTGEIAGL